MEIFKLLLPLVSEFLTLVHFKQEVHHSNYGKDGISDDQLFESMGEWM